MKQIAKCVQDLVYAERDDLLRFLNEKEEVLGQQILRLECIGWNLDPANTTYRSFAQAEADLEEYCSSIDHVCAVAL